MPEPAPEPVTIRIRAVGDMVPGNNYPHNHLHPNPRELFAAVQPFLEGADVLFGNFESTMTRSNAAAKDVRRPNVFAFRNPPEYAQLLKQVGFDVLSVANNHAYDFGHQGFLDTVANIEAAGITAVGVKDKIAYTEVKGLRIGWVGFSTSPNQNSILALGSAASLVRQAQANADIVVVSFHGGAEGTGAAHTRNQTEYFFGENRGNVVAFSRQMVAAGADLVLGHGPHIPRAMELYQGRLIAYSLGNFVGYRTLSTRGALAYSLVLEAELDAQGNFQRGQIFPVLITPPGIPQRSTRSESIALIRRLTATDFPETPLVITLDGRLQPRE
ncbi:MAG: CapA family protein [Spirulina sp. DLM2.Bin59]|nr:MAG: CapA family protein [Spirulina sp. DLM2.Bin59]